MKRSVILSAAILACLTVSARQLTPEEALQRIPSREISRVKGSAAQPQPRLVHTGMTPEGHAAYYMFDTGSSTVFASADDVAAPLLGYTDKAIGSVADMPPSMAWWLEQYAREIAWAAANGITYSASTTADADMTPIAPLVKTTWDQGAPYNDLCPEKKGEHTYTGCVATSMAQVMNYHQWPQRATGTVSYDWNNQTLTADLATIPLDWNLMLDSYPTGSAGSEEQRLAVSRLMMACGYSLHMNYGLAEDNGSGAYSSDLPGALVGNFGYDAATRYEYRDFYTLVDWEQMIYDNLANVGPVIYGGQGSMGGHSFVCDGYSGNGLFHINWGWGGTSDGDFRLSALDPPNLGAGGGDGGFNSDQDAILGIRRPQSGSEAPKPFIGCAKRIYATAEGYDLIIGPERTMPPSLFCNYGSSPATFTFGVMLVNDATGKTDYVVSDNVVDHTLAPMYGLSMIEVELPTDMPDGQYKVFPVYRIDSNEWQKIKLLNTAPQYIEIEISDSEVTVDSESLLPGIYIVDVDPGDGITVGEPYAIEVELANTYPRDMDVTVAGYLKSNGLTEDFTDETKVSIPAGETATTTLTGTVSSTTSPGVYDLDIEADEMIIGTIHGIIVHEASEITDTYSDMQQSTTDKWYDLTGTPVSYDRLAPGTYIRVSDGKAEKVLIK